METALANSLSIRDYNVLEKRASQLADQEAHRLLKEMSERELIHQHLKKLWGMADFGPFEGAASEMLVMIAQEKTHAKKIDHIRQLLQIINNELDHEEYKVQYYYSGPLNESLKISPEDPLGLGDDPNYIKIKNTQGI